MKGKGCNFFSKMSKLGGGLNSYKIHGTKTFEMKNEMWKSMSIFMESRSIDDKLGAEI